MDNLRVFDEIPTTLKALRLNSGNPPVEPPHTAWIEFASKYPGVRDAFLPEGSLIERVSLTLPLVDGIRPVLVVDEEGLMKSEQRVPGYGVPNAIASVLYWRGRQSMGKVPIFGPAIILGEALVVDEDGMPEPDFVPLPDTFRLPDYAIFEG